MVIIYIFIFSYRFGGFHSSNGSFTATPSLSTDCSTVYIGSNNELDQNSFYAINVTSGLLIWKYDTPSIVLSASAVSGDGYIIFGCLDG